MYPPDPSGHINAFSMALTCGEKLKATEMRTTIVAKQNAFTLPLPFPRAYTYCT